MKVYLIDSKISTNMYSSQNIYTHNYMTHPTKVIKKRLHYVCRLIITISLHINAATVFNLIQTKTYTNVIKMNA